MDTPTRSESSVSSAQQAAIEEAITEMAWEHLRSADAETALSYYEPDALVASNGVLYASFEEFARHVREFYRTLREIHVAVWDQMHVDIVSAQLAVLTATFRWSSTDTAGVRTTLRGVWTAVLVQRDGRWRMRTRHESFTGPPSG